MLRGSIAFWGEIFLFALSSHLYFWYILLGFVLVLDINLDLMIISLIDIFGWLHIAILIDQIFASVFFVFCEHVLSCN